METASRRRPLLAALGLAVTVLITLVALAARSSSLQAGDGPTNAGPVIVIVHVIEIGGIALELLAILILIVVFRLARRRDEDDDDEAYQEPVRVHWLVRLLSNLLPPLVLAAMIVAITRSRPVDQSLELTPIGDFGASPGSGGFAEQVVSNLGLSWWEVLIAVVLAVLAFIAILRAFRTYRAPVSTPDEEPEVLRQTSALVSAVGAGLRDARLEPDPRRAVITAYATMERMLAAQGWPRREVEAPLEYMTRLFAERNVRADALVTLTELFELARFSHHVISPASKEHAIGALTVIDQELRSAR
jgi:hypothetical protein